MQPKQVSAGPRLVQTAKRPHGRAEPTPTRTPPRQKLALKDVLQRLRANAAKKQAIKYAGALATHAAKQPAARSGPAGRQEPTVRQEAASQAAKVRTASPPAGAPVKKLDGEDGTDTGSVLHPTPERDTPGAITRSILRQILAAVERIERHVQHAVEHSVKQAPRFAGTKAGANVIKGTRDPGAEQSLTAVEVAARLSVGKSTVYKWIKSRGFPQGTPIGNKCTRWLARDVDAWLEAQKTAAAAATDVETGEHTETPLPSQTHSTAAVRPTKVGQSGHSAALRETHAESSSEKGKRTPCAEPEAGIAKQG